MGLVWRRMWATVCTVAGSWISILKGETIMTTLKDPQGVDIILIPLPRVPNSYAAMNAERRAAQKALIEKLRSTLPHRNMQLITTEP